MIMKRFIPGFSESKFIKRSQDLLFVLMSHLYTAPYLGLYPCDVSFPKGAPTISLKRRGQIHNTKDLIVKCIKKGCRNHSHWRSQYSGYFLSSTN